MRPFLPGIAVLLAVTVFAGCTAVGAPAPDPPPPADIDEPFPPPRPVEEADDVPPRDRQPVPARFREVRALWVVRSTLTSPDRIRTMVERAHGAGFNTLVVQVRGRGDAYYASELEPRADALAAQPATFDPLALVLEEAHARGMAVHAWLNAHLVADARVTPGDRGHVVRARPDLLAVPRELSAGLYATDPYDPSYVEALRRHAWENRARVEGLYTNPSHPDVHDRIRDVWVDVVRRYPVDGVHFDYARYPHPTYDYSRPSLEAFVRWARPRVGSRALGVATADHRNPLAWVEAFPEEWDRFRREQITSLVARVYRDVKAVRPDVVVSAAVFADRIDAYGARYQDWGGWLDEGIVDVVAPMAYSPDDRAFRRHVAAAVEAAGDARRVWAGIGAYLTGFDGTVRKIGIAREVGATGVVLFSYDWIVAEGDGPGDVTFLDGVGRSSFGVRGDRPDRERR